jgi:Ca2+-transporting ATPase
MNRPPRDPKQPLFNRSTLGLSLLQGAVVLLVTFAVYWFALKSWHLEEKELRALTYVTLIFANLFLILSNRSWTQSIFSSFRSRNRAMNWVLSGAVIFLILVLTVPFLRNLFSFSALKPVELAISFGAALLSVLWFEIYKMVKYRNK